MTYRIHRDGVARDMTAAEQDAFLAGLPQPAGPAVPASIALWQFRREAKARGWWPLIQQAVAELPAEDRATVEEWLEYGSQVDRSAPRLLDLARGIGLSAADIDQAFVAAAGRSP